MNLALQRSIAMRNHLKALYIQARGNLLMMLCFTAVNLLLLFFNAGVIFLFSATMPYLSLLFGILDETGALAIPGGVFAVVLVAVYFLCWLFSKENPRWMLAALVLFIMDTVCLGVYCVLAKDFTGILDVVFHALVLYYLVSGLRAAKKLESLPPEELTYVDDFRLEDVPEEETVLPNPKEQRTTDWEFDFSTLPHWKNRLEIPYIYDAFLPFEKADLLFCVHSVAEVTMLNYRGFFSILENKESPRVVFSLQEGIVGPNLYPSGKEGYLCFEAYCRGKGSVSLLYSVHRKAFAVLERPSGNLARACFSEDEETVTLVEGNGSSMQFVMDTLTWIPPERLEETLKSMEKTVTD